MPPPELPAARPARPPTRWCRASNSRSTRPQSPAHVPDSFVLHRLESQGIRERRAGSAGGGLRRHRGAAGRRRRRRLRQHRRGAAGVAVVHRAVRHCRARRRREGDGPRGRAAGRLDVPRRTPESQLTHVPGLPLGTRGGILANVDLPSDGEYVVDIADMATHIWGNGMEFENPLVVTLDNKVVYETVVGGEEDMKAVRPGAERRARSRERAPEEHPLQGHRRAAQDRRHVPPADLRRVGRPAADVHEGRRPGSLLSRAARSRCAGRSMPAG